MLSFSQIPSLDADVLIAGGGPAGASAATYLSRAGMRVLLMDLNFPVQFYNYLLSLFSMILARHRKTLLVLVFFLK
jgi:2-polyprenyl-6-methoxyphenol hydroxylase-like FAD-dependent oxidoreductase